MARNSQNVKLLNIVKLTSFPKVPNRVTSISRKDHLSITEHKITKKCVIKIFSKLFKTHQIKHLAF